MNFDPLINWFIHPDYLTNTRDFRQARLLVSACLLTSLFSTSYVLLSVVFSFERGMYFTGANVVGYFALPFLMRTRLSLTLIGNIYTAMGATTVMVLTWFSGGMWSAIYPWIIAIPVLALLIAGRASAIYWGVLSLFAMLAFGFLELQGISLPVEYDVENRTLWFLSILPGLLLIIMVVSMTFEAGMQRALADVEAQKATIEKQSAALVKLIEEKDHIIGILAHDLRNPLANIGILAQMLAEEQDGAEQRRILGMIEKASGAAHTLVKDVLETASLEQGNDYLRLQPIMVLTMVQEVVQSLNSIAENKNIRIGLKYANPSLAVLADPTYVRQVMENLISNALKFSTQGETIEVSFTNNGEHTQIRVRDFGPGVPKGEEGRLFKRFSRLSSQPTGGESSSGLGLSLVKRYMELMKGNIWHEHPVDGGALFIAEFLNTDMEKLTP